MIAYGNENEQEKSQDGFNSVWTEILELTTTTTWVFFLVKTFFR